MFYDNTLKVKDQEFVQKLNHAASNICKSAVYGDVIICSPKSKFYDMYSINSFKNLDNKFKLYILNSVKQVKWYEVNNK